LRAIHEWLIDWQRQIASWRDPSDQRCESHRHQRRAAPPAAVKIKKLESPGSGLESTKVLEEPKRLTSDLGQHKLSLVMSKSKKSAKVWVASPRLFLFDIDFLKSGSA
jgi:hypothetical protein